MKLSIMIPLIAVFSLSACTLGGQTPPAARAPATDVPGSAAEQNVPPAAPAGETNVSLFGRDTGATVDAAEVSTPEVKGYVARPKADGAYPGVVMVHEWWGLNDNIKEMARLLANEGYTVFAVDLYDGRIATSADEARRFSGSVNAAPEAAVAKLKAAADHLKDRYSAPKVGSLGWCFGGGQSLNLSLAEPLDATVIYYGQLTTDETRLDAIKGPVLGIFGETDASIPTTTVAAFKSRLDKLGKANEVYVYPGVGHAFANPSGANYAADETRDAWGKTLAFLSANLKGAVTGTAPAERTVTVIKLTGKDFRFYRDGVESPVLRVKAGDTVRIELAVLDMTHDLVIDEFSAATDQVGAGQTTSVEFTAPRAGEYEYYCSVGNHRAMGMAGKFIVE
jgi:carboxymethylenebutenolidase